MENRYPSSVSDSVKRSSGILRENTRWVTLSVIILAVIVTLVMAICDKYLEHGERYLMGATYFNIIAVIICMYLFVNLCIGYGSKKM